jgi:hypothetical protein
MPTRKYKSLEHAFQALTDLEIEDDSRNFPVARIKVPGLHEIEIKMVSEYDFYYILQPLQNKILNYYVNRFNESKDEITVKRLTEKIKNIIEDISNIQTSEDVEKKSSTLGYLFEEEEIRKEFFDGLKKLGIIKEKVKWVDYQKAARPIDTLTIFCFLWQFNFTGLKKNAKYLIEKITADTNYHLPTVSTNYGDWDTYKLRLEKAHQRKPWLNSSKN